MTTIIIVGLASGALATLVGYYVCFRCFRNDNSDRSATLGLALGPIAGACLLALLCTYFVPPETRGTALGIAFDGILIMGFAGGVVGLMRRKRRAAQPTR